MMNSLKKLVPQPIRNIKHYLISMFFNSYYGYPSKKLKIIGVTGTDGKTTTATMIYKILQQSGKKTGLISTIQAKIGEKDYPLGFHVTTPNPQKLQKFLKDMVDEGLEYVVLETTSHGLDQHRVAGIKYIGAVYTNVTHEHLDYHRTYDSYLDTKAKLIDRTTPTGFVVINADDKSFTKLKAKSIKRKTIRYGIENEADVKAESIVETKSNSEFQVNSFVNTESLKFKVRLPISGRYNIYNALAAISAGLYIGAKPEQIQEALSKFEHLEGRWDIMQKEPFQVVIDFAHTPNALEKALTNARNQVINSGRVIAVFGTAGLRDAQKRPMMGEIAGRLADITIMTSEDPRSEKIEDINKQIESGLLKHNLKSGVDYFSIPDRKEAIQRAIQMGRKDDIIVITGKGHEKSMNLDGKTETPWDEHKVVNEILMKRKNV